MARMDCRDCVRLPVVHRVTRLRRDDARQGRRQTRAAAAGSLTPLAPLAVQAALQYVAFHPPHRLRIGTDHSQRTQLHRPAIDLVR